MFPKVDGYTNPQNQLLAALTENEYTRISPHLELVSLPPGYVLHESGVRMYHAYFPITAVVPLLYDMENGTSAEIALIGNEGMVSRFLRMLQSRQSDLRPDNGLALFNESQTFS